MDATQLELFWKVLLVVLTASQAVSAAGYLVGRWQQKQEGSVGSQAVDLRRLDAEMLELRRWRHEAEQEEAKSIAALYRVFISREEFAIVTARRNDEALRIWAELARLRNGKH